MGKGSGSGQGAIVNDESSVVTSSSDVTFKHVPNTAIRQPSRKPRGFQNVGNSCYANAALQCLMNTALSNALLHPESVAIFRRYSSNPSLLEIGCTGSVAGYDSDDDDFLCLTREEKCEIRRREMLRRKTQETSRWLTRELTDITRKYTSHASQNNGAFFGGFMDSTADIVNPGNITKHPDRLSQCLRPYQQEDAHEFIRALLSTLTMNGHNKQLSSLFDGLLESAVTCQRCQNVSITRDRYMDLSLDISHKEVKTLEDALALFTDTEILAGDNKVTCEVCEKKRVVSKGLRLATAPSVLVCHLKRFAFDKYGRMVRLSKNIGFPRRLNLGGYMSRANKAAPPPYELMGVLVHQGRSCDHGHYLSYVKSGGKWYRANDSDVTEVDKETVLQQPAYILIYEVAGMRARHSMRDITTRIGSNRTIDTTDAIPSAPKLNGSVAPGKDGVGVTLMSLLCTASEVNDAIFRDFCCGGSSGGDGTRDDDIVVTRMGRRRHSVSNIRYTFRDDNTVSDLSTLGNSTIDASTVDNSTVNTSDQSKVSSEGTPLRKSSSSSNLRELEHKASKAYIDEGVRPRQRGLLEGRPVSTTNCQRYHRSRRSQSATTRRTAVSSSPRQSSRLRSRGERGRRLPPRMEI